MVMTIEFLWNDQPVILQGDFHVSTELISLHQFLALIHGDDILNLFELHHVPLNTQHVDSPLNPALDIEFPSTLPAL